MRPSVWTLRGVLIASGLLVAAAGWTALETPRLALLLLAVALLPGFVFVAWAPWLERLYQRPGPTRTPPT